MIPFPDKGIEHKFSCLNFIRYTHVMVSVFERSKYKQPIASQTHFPRVLTNLWVHNIINSSEIMTRSFSKLLLMSTFVLYQNV